MHRIEVAERRARIVRRHRLHPGERGVSALEVARSLVALHSTDAATVFLSVNARAEGVTTDDVERALYVDRVLVRMLGMRRTLFVVPRDLVPVVQAACTTVIATRERRRLESMIRASEISTRPGIWLARAEKAALEALSNGADASTAELTKRVPLLARRLRAGAGTRWEITQSAGSRVLPQLAMQGRLVRGRPRGSWISGQYRWAPTASWLGSEIPELEREAARAELLRRWLGAFGPATETDIRWWTSWTARDTRAALATVPHGDVDLDGARGFVLAGDVESTEPLEPAAALLPTLDSTTMGWKERGWYLGAHESVLFDRNGNAGPTVWWDGRVVGGWSQRRDGEIVVGLLEDVGEDAARAIEAEAERLAAWFGDVRIAPGFLPPYQRELAA